MKKERKLDKAVLRGLLCAYAEVVREQGLKDAGHKGDKLRGLMIARDSGVARPINTKFNAILRYVFGKDGAK